MLHLRNVFYNHKKCNSSSWISVLCSCLNVLYTNSMDTQVLLDKLLVPLLVQKFPTRYESLYSLVFKTARHLLLSWDRRIESTPSHPVSVWSILILLCHLHLSSRCLFRLRLPNPCTHLSSPMRSLYLNNSLIISSSSSSSSSWGAGMA
jgi:hypothetical protein